MNQFKIAIQPDEDASRADRRTNSSSPHWADYIEKAGHLVKWADVTRPDILEQVRDCQAFMWRWKHYEGHPVIARRLLPVLENQMGLAVYPDQKTCWHFDDKIAQAYLFEALNLPTAKTWIWFDRAAAIKWARNEAPYPLVLKLATGASSKNVRKIENAREAETWIKHCFEDRRINLANKFPHKMSELKEYCFLYKDWLEHWGVNKYNGLETQSGYVYFQEFLAQNDYDTRITVIGKRAFGFRRLNRAGDFRASGSGRLDYDLSKIDQAFIRLAFRLAQSLGMQSCAVDGVYRDGQPIILEVSFAYVSSAVEECQGRWELQGDAETGKIKWVEGRMWPEEAQAEDLLARLRQKFGSI